MSLSEQILQNFIHVCHRTYEAWITHRILFDDNPHAEELKQSKYGALLGRLSEITGDYAVLQLAKLHDPAVQRKGKNLSLEYIIENGGWNDETASTLRQLHSQLDALYQQIKPARDKILAHSDLTTLANNRTLGAFTKDADLEYFEVLQKFISVVQGGPFEFGAFVVNDATTFVDGLHNLLSLRR